MDYLYIFFRLRVVEYFFSFFEKLPVAAISGSCLLRYSSASKQRSMVNLLHDHLEITAFLHPDAPLLNSKEKS